MPRKNKVSKTSAKHITAQATEEKEKEIEDLKVENESLKQENASLIKANESLIKENATEEKEKEIKHLKAENESLKEENASLIKENAHLKDKIPVTTDNLTNDLELNGDKLQHELAGTSHLNFNRTSDFATLKESLQIAKSICDSLCSYCRENKVEDELDMYLYKAGDPEVCKLAEPHAVFIKSQRREELMKMASSTQVANQALLAVFKQNFLTTCTVEGKLEGKNPLPVTGLQAVIDFVRIYEKENNRPEVPDYIIKKNLGNKLWNLQNKRTKKTKKYKRNKKNLKIQNESDESSSTSDATDDNIDVDDDDEQEEDEDEGSSEVEEKGGKKKRKKLMKKEKDKKQNRNKRFKSNK